MALTYAAVRFTAQHGLTISRDAFRPCSHAKEMAAALFWTHAVRSLTATWRAVLTQGAGSTVFGRRFVVKGAAAEQGGAILLSACIRAEFEDGVFAENRAVTHGGAIYAMFTDLTLQRVNFTRNFVANDDNRVAVGGAIACSGNRRVAIVSSDLTNNFAVASSEVNAKGGGAGTVLRALLLFSRHVLLDDARAIH